MFTLKVAAVQQLRSTSVPRCIKYQTKCLTSILITQLYFEDSYLYRSRVSNARSDDILNYSNVVHKKFESVDYSLRSGYYYLRMVVTFVSFVLSYYSLAGVLTYTHIWFVFVISLKSYKYSCSGQQRPLTNKAEDNQRCCRQCKMPEVQFLNRMLSVE